MNVQESNPVIACENCCWYREHDIDNGYCHRWAPQAGIVSPLSPEPWPKVQPRDFCAEFKMTVPPKIKQEERDERATQGG